MSGYLTILSININTIGFYVGIFAYNTTFQLSIIIPSICALITFIRLRQSDKYLTDLLNLRWNNWRLLIKQRSYHVRILNRFYKCHLQCRCSTFSQNRIFSRQLVLNLMTYTPINAYMIWSVLLKTLARVIRIIFIFMACAQMLYIFGIHLVAVQYPSRLHRAGKLLQQVNVRFFPPNMMKRMIDGGDRSGVANEIRIRLKLAQTFELIHNQRRYGITYGPAQLVTMATFAKVCLQNIIILIIYILKFSL